MLHRLRSRDQGLRMPYAFILALLLVGGGLIRAADTTAPAAGADGDFPIWIELERPQLVTVVIEDANGVVVRNLVAETRLPAGRNRLSWDGYDNGTGVGDDGDLVRRRVAPGAYRARGLTHDGLTLVYEFTVYSGGTPPWPTAARTARSSCRPRAARPMAMGRRRCC